MNVGVCQRPWWHNPAFPLVPLCLDCPDSSLGRQVAPICGYKATDGPPNMAHHLVCATDQGGDVGSTA